MNFPDIKLNIPTITEKDKNDIINFGLKHNVDMIALSFARSAKCINDCRNLLGKENKHIKIIPKIENFEGLENLKEIL